MSLPIQKGDMEFRNGIYSTNDRLKYDLQGMYYWQSGVLYVECNPKELRRLYSSTKPY